MKLFTAIVALAGMSSATASLRGGAVLPSEMKDLLNKLVAADEGVASCDAVQFQKCNGLDVTVNCPPNTLCNWVGERHFGNVPGATAAGFYCTQGALEEDELVEESAELESANPSCGVLGSDDGGCVVNGFAGLSCMAGYTCEGYAPGTNPTLGKCVLDTNRDVDNRTHATICNEDFYIGIPCSVNGECHGHWVNPNNCEAVCRNGVCSMRGAFEEEEEELAAEDNDLPLNERHCLITTDSEQPRCSFVNGKEIPTTGAVCCSMTAETDGSKKYSHNDVTCDYFGNNPNNVANSDSGPGFYCRLNPGEDLAVN